jgi:glycosyltransferase involved in cell wall biosynthesis
MTDPLLRQAPGPTSMTAATVHPGARAGSRPRSDRAPHVLDLTVVMPTVGFDGDFEFCALRVLACLDRAACAGEFVVALDGPAVPTPAWLDRPDVRIIATGSRSGPAVARNAAAEIARGGIVLFVDADVELAPDALERVLAAFGSDPDLVGVFGNSATCSTTIPTSPTPAGRPRSGRGAARCGRRTSWMSAGSTPVSPVRASRTSIWGCG